MDECRFIKQDGWIEIYKQYGWIEIYKQDGWIEIYKQDGWMQIYKTRRVAGKGKQWLLVTLCADYVYTSLYICYLYSMSLSNISLSLQSPNFINKWKGIVCAI